MTLAFGVVLWILKKFAWKPILESIHKREETIDNALKEAERARAEIQNLRLNAAYRGKDNPTNVLSFPAPAGMAADGPRALGDVVLALETLLDEAAAAGIPPAHHFQHLLIHGLLHLSGYDHEADAEAERMEALETALLARLGVPDPYAPDPSPNPAMEDRP
jgi:probable rRNA maturation factor